VLRIVAPLLAQTVRARALTRDLKESRATAITAIEEERLRLRRDLHDGLGPTLSGIALTADAVRSTLTADPARTGPGWRRLGVMAASFPRCLQDLGLSLHAPPRRRLSPPRSSAEGEFGRMP
jgi:signal transduction histidine kinase